MKVKDPSNRPPAPDVDMMAMGCRLEDFINRTMLNDGEEYGPSFDDDAIIGEHLQGSPRSNHTATFTFLPPPGICRPKPMRAPSMATARNGRGSLSSFSSSTTTTMTGLIAHPMSPPSSELTVPSETGSESSYSTTNLRYMFHKTLVFPLIPHH